MSDILAKAHALARGGRPAEAQSLVEDAAACGDGDALLMLANWRLFGMYGERDVAAGHDYLGLAAVAGNAEAARILAGLVAAGTGCDADFERARAMLAAIPDDRMAALQLDLLERAAAPDSALALQRTTLSRDPLVFHVDGLLGDEECRYLRTAAEPRMRPSFVLDPTTGGQMPHPVRTSHGTNFGPTEEDLVINNINRRIAALTATEPGSGEPLHMLRYSPGQEYRPHIDALPGAANQRLWTVLVYLNDGYDGGETVFPDLGLRFRGNVGDALVFRNLTDDCRPDVRTRHAGLPVTGGVKWLATRWIRSSAYSPWDGLA